MDFQAAEPVDLAADETRSKEVQTLLTAFAVLTGVPFATLVIITFLRDMPW